MSKYYTVLCIDDKGKPVRETLISLRFLRSLAALGLISMAVIGMGAYHFIDMRDDLAGKNALLAQLNAQESTIADQRSQIQSFAQKFNTLKSTMISLNEFEQKIRIMANLEHKTDSASLLAVGGSMPEDLDSNLPLVQDHDRLVREMHNQMEQVQQVGALQENSFTTLLKSLEDKRNLLAATPSLRPVKGWISSNFGYRVSPFTGRKEFHKGLDIASRAGSQIIAPADGVVTYSGKKWLMGNMMTIDHGYGMITRYGHIQKLLKKKGNRVKRGELIALVGSTGRSTGPHVHYEVRLNGVPVNPVKYILD